MTLRYILLFIPLTVCRAYYELNPSNGFGRIFDGIGAISGGGATSKLLVSYPEKERNEILDYLFKPNFGASLHILKVEIGGDAQSTDGTESSHMHESWDENYDRGYEWWLMKEAKKRNPAIKLIGLPWAYPAWVGENNNPYAYPNKTSLYVVKWILGAKKFHGLDIDYIGIWNERNHDIKYIRMLKSTLVSHKLDNVKIIVADSDWSVSKDVLNDPSFAGAIDVIGVHYPGTNTTDEALKTNKTLWSSEDYSTFNDDVGAGCQARILNQNYVNGHMTSTIVWNLVASYYEELPFGRDGLMIANEPWGGHYEVSNPVWITAHTTQFTNIGWTYLKHGSGVGRLDSGGSYVTLVSPDGLHFTMVIETMTRKNSFCIRPALPDYNVSSQEAEFFLRGSLASIDKFYVWKTDFKIKEIFQEAPPIEPIFSSFRIILEPDQVYTLTTLTSGAKGSYNMPPNPKPFPRPYFDDYEDYEENNEARYFVPQSGVWEVRRESNDSENKVNRQVVLRRPINWCFSGDHTVNIGGDHKWKNVDLSVHVLIPKENGTVGSFLGVRIKQGGCETSATPGIFFAVYPGNSSYSIFCSIDRTCSLGSGKLNPPAKFNTWHELGISMKGSQVAVSFDGRVVAMAISPDGNVNGFVGYGTTTFGYADFDDLTIGSRTSVRPGGHINIMTTVARHLLLLKKLHRHRPLQNTPVKFRNTFDSTTSVNKNS